MITHEPFLKDFFESNPILTWAMIAFVTIAVLLAGKYKNRKLIEIADEVDDANEIENKEEVENENELDDKHNKI
jgi:hypothetical protein